MYWKFPNDLDFYGIAGVQKITEDLEVPLEIIVERNQEISIGVDELQNINKAVFLKDAQTNTFYNITNTKVSLQLESGNFRERFYLVFKESSVLEVNEDVFLDSFSIKLDRETKILTVKNNGNNTVQKITIYSILGQKIVEVKGGFKLNEKEIRIKTNALQETIYVVSIETDKGKIVKKFF